MLLLNLIIIPLFGIFTIAIAMSYGNINRTRIIKIIALTATIIDLILSLIIFILFDYSSKQFQFVQEQYSISNYDIYLGIDGLSVYFVLLTTLIMPISLISN
jgi:NADH:ubiquinone oxidoreductase subunit 4 (subunit M)